MIFDKLFDKPLLLIALASLYGFAYARSFLSGLIYYMLNKNAYRKRKKGQTFKEWLLYNRYNMDKIIYYNVFNN